MGVVLVGKIGTASSTWPSQGFLMFVFADEDDDAEVSSPLNDCTLFSM